MFRKSLSIILIFLGCIFSAQNIERQINIQIGKLSKSLISSRDDNFTLSTADKILALDSNNLQAIWFKGVALEYVKGYAEGVLWIDKFLKLRPNSRLYYYRAEMKMKAKDKVGAIRDIENALKMATKDPEIFKAAAEIYRLTNMYDEAYQYYDSATFYARGNYQVYQSYAMAMVAAKDLDKANRICDEAIKKINGNVTIDRRRYAIIFALKANICFLMTKYQDAVVAADQSILALPEAGSYRLRSKCYLKMNKNELACADYKEMLKMNPRMPYGEDMSCDKDNYEYPKEWIKKLNSAEYYTKGYGKMGQGKEEAKEAVQLFTKAVDIDASNHLALANRACAYMVLDDYKNALKDIDKALEIKPDNFDSYNIRFSIGLKLENYKGALSDINKDLQLQPNNPSYWVDRGHLKTLMGDSTDAISDYLMAVSLDNNYALAYHELGLLEMNVKKDLKAASEHLKMAIEKRMDNPFGLTSPYYYYEYANVLDKLGKYDDALDYIEKAIACEPESAEWYLKAGEINARAKNMKKACEEWNTAKQLGSKKAEEVLHYNCEN